MSEDKNKEQASWQENAARPSNFNKKDNNLEKDGKGNLKVKDDDKISKEDNEMIQETLDSLSVDDEDEKDS